MAENGDHFLNPDVIRGTSDKEPVLVPFMCSSNKEIEAVDTVSTEDPAEGDMIMVGVVGSATPWFLTGWTNDVEVEFMIDTGCQVTILATSVFDRMCDIHPEVRNGLVPCAQRLVSADSYPLTVMGRINLNVVFPGLQCDMWCVVAGIGTDGLLGTEALQSCLPHQLDLRTGQLWANGRSTLQLHQQKSTPSVSGSLITAVVRLLVTWSLCYLCRWPDRRSICRRQRQRNSRNTWRTLSGGRTLPWEIPVVNPCVIYSTSINMCSRRRGNQ